MEDEVPNMLKCLLACCFLPRTGTHKHLDGENPIELYITNGNATMRGQGEMTFRVASIRSTDVVLLPPASAQVSLDGLQAGPARHASVFPRRSPSARLP